MPVTIYVDINGRINEHHADLPPTDNAIQEYVHNTGGKLRNWHLGLPGAEFEMVV